jgi:integrase
VVQERLGHATMGQTMDTYSHVAATLGQAAAARWDAETTRDEVPEKAPVTNS